MFDMKDRIMKQKFRENFRKQKCLNTKTPLLQAVFFLTYFAISNLVCHIVPDAEECVRFRQTVLTLHLRFSDQYHAHLSRT